MKRFIALLLSIMTCILLCACGKSHSVKEVESVIKAIGEVTLDSGEAIEKAERMYEYLTEKEREQVENKGKLVEARFTYNKIYTDKVYATAKEAYELLKEAARLYYFNSTNLYKAGNFGNNANMMVTDSDFCEKFAAATGDYQNYPKYTEDEVREALAITKKMYEDDGWEWSSKATMKVCMNLHFQAFYEVRDYKPSSAVEEAGVLLLELKDTYHDEKYYPVLLEYRDFVASGDALTLNISRLQDIPDKQREYQNEYTQCEMKIDPMFMN